MAKKVNVDSIKVPKTEKGKVLGPVVNVPKAPKESIWTKELFAKRKTNQEDKEKKFFHRRRVIEWAVIFLVFFVPVFLFAGATFAEGVIYKDKIFPGVTVWGIDVGGKTPEEVQKVILDKYKNYQITLNGPDQDYSAKAADLGLIVDPKIAAENAFEIGKKGSFIDKYFIRGRLLLSLINLKEVKNTIGAEDFKLTPNYQVDDKMVDHFVEEISENINIQAQDSQVSTEGGNLKLVPAIYGREMAKEKLKQAILENVKAFGTDSIAIETTKIKPNIIDKDAEEVRVQTENVIARPIVLTFNGQTFQPDKATVASWISYTKAPGATNYTMVVDPAKMDKYFNFLGTKVNIYSVSKHVRIENGVKETVTREGKDGLLIDKALLGRQIAGQLPVQPEVNLSIPTYVDKFKTEYERVVVANWDKYIDVNLSTQTMTAYLKGGQVVGSWLITSAATGKGYHTPIGTSLIYGKIYVTSMPNPPSPYPLENIHYVSYFRSGGYAIHEAWWRSSFGGDPTWNGSHGCVNAPIGVAKFIYDWAPIGTPVTVHY